MGKKSQTILKIEQHLDGTATPVEHFSQTKDISSLSVLLLHDFLIQSKSKSQMTISLSPVIQTK